MFRLIRDTRLLLWMHIRDTLRNPVWLILGMIQPIVWLLLFAPLLESLMAGPGFQSDNAINFFTPGLLVMLAVLSTLFAGMGVIGDTREGVMEKLRVTPMSRLALPVSLLIRDWLMLVIQMLVLIGVGLLMGLRPDPLGLVLKLALVSLVGLFVAAISYALALALKNEYGLSAISNFLVLPLVLLSGITLPLTLAPPFLQTLGRINPLSHAVDAARALTAGELTHAAIVPGFVLFAGLLALAFVWAVSAFRSATR